MENLRARIARSEEFFRTLLEPKAIGEELQKLRWEKIIEFLEISIVQ